MLRARRRQANGLAVLKFAFLVTFVLLLQGPLFAIQAGSPVGDANRALAYQRAGQIDKALAVYAALDSAAQAQHKPLPAAVLANYARALAAAGHLEQAVLQMKAATLADSRNAVFEDDLGSIYARQQQWSEAQRHFADATRIAPSLAMPHLHLGLALQAQGDQQAVQEFARATKLAPQNNAIVFEYGKALASAGKDTQAVDIFQSILARAQPESDPTLMDATYALALALQRTGRMPESIPLLRKVIALEPDNTAAMVNLGLALSQTRQTADAVATLQHAVALAPQNVVAHQDLAAALVQANQFADAIVQLHAALQLEPDLPQLHYDLGYAYKMQDDAANAIPELEAAERLDVHQAEAPYLLGILYMQTGRYEDAARELKSSLSLRPQNGDGWATLGSVCSKLGQLPEATSALKEAIRQLPEQPDPRLTLAAVLMKQNKTAEATEQRRQAATLMKRSSNKQRAEVATHSGESLLKKGDLTGAAVQFNEALGFDGSFAEAHTGLAKIYDAQGKKSEAAAERQKAAAGGSTSASR